MEPTRSPRCCPQCGTHLLPEETVCNKCSNNTRLPPRRDCPWCAEPLPRGMVICRHCHADLAVPAPEPIHCATCGAVVSAQALACIRCGTPVAASVTAADEADRTQPLDTPASVTDAFAPGRAAHIEREFTPAPRPRSATNSLPVSIDPPPVGMVSASFLCGAIVGLFVQASVFGWLIGRGLLPVPRDWLDLRVTAWIVAHAAAFAATMLVAILAAGCWSRIPRRRVWSPGAIAFSVAAPSLAFPWMVGRLWQGLLQPGSSDEAGPMALAASDAPPQDALLSTRTPRSGGWTVLALAEAGIALGVCAALVWPQSWRPALPNGVLACVDWVQTSGLWLRWLLAIVGVGHIFAAAFGWYWETYEEGGIVTWLSPVVLLAPGLVFLSTALLTGLGTDIAGPEGFSLSTALRDSVLLWGLLSLYGLYYLITSWGAMQELVTVAVLGYVLCGPVMLSGWSSGRRATHGLECGRRLSQLAAGLRAYAENYQQLPPPVVFDSTGRPLHSWRVLLLPFVGQEKLYREFDLNAAWDAPTNRELLARRPDLFACDELDWNDTASTQLLAVVDERTFFPPGEPVASRELSGPGAKRLVFVEVAADRRIPWTAPQDLSAEDIDRIDLHASSHGDRLHAVNAEGTVVEVRPETGPEDAPLPLQQQFWRPSARLR